MFQEDPSDWKSINCSENFSIRVTWANYGPLAKQIPAQFQPNINSCTTNKTTNMMKVRCDGRKMCRFYVTDSDFVGQECSSQPDYLVIRYTCERNTKPGTKKRCAKP